jgi:hypothetical protein
LQYKVTFCLAAREITAVVDPERFVELLNHIQSRNEKLIVLDAREDGNLQIIMPQHLQAVVIESYTPTQGETTR